ncbi:hypothetical protein F0562_022017 [Nyssa sinensis]|uniref:SHSP domain-containing protein n=1 Tax=Nyssa sinensis TaxID=561372 RepID=A0A5J5BMD6_9ASTE|nr:hypothetical protein F0562_022017 [Nyssa sinensis]
MAESLQAPHFSPGSSLSHSDFRPVSPEPSTVLPLVARTPRALAPLGSHPMLTRAKAGVFKPRHLAHLGLDFPFAASEVSTKTAVLADARVDWKETPEAHVFKADLPGMKKEEVMVEIEDDRVLQISGERNVVEEDKNDTWHPVERSSGKFMRRLRLPENAKMDQVKATMENGVLTVTVPKEEVMKPDVKTIEISG